MIGNQEIVSAHMPSQNHLVIATRRQIALVKITFDGLPRFEIIDKFAINHSISCLFSQPYNNGYLVSYVHSGSKVLEKTLNTSDEFRMEREVLHQFNFKFKAVSILPLQDSCFLIADEAGTGFVIKAVAKSERFNRLYKTHKILGVIPLKERILIYDQSKTTDRLKELKSISISDAVKDLVDSHKLVSAFNLSRMTG